MKYATDKELCDKFILARYYYKIGEPSLSDFEYDALLRTLEHKGLLSEYTSRTYDDDPVPYELLPMNGTGESKEDSLSSMQSIGESKEDSLSSMQSIGESKEDSLSFLAEDKSMSIKKVDNMEEVFAFVNTFRGHELNISIKMDGDNIKSEVENSQWKMSLTRGRDSSGIEVTNAMLHIIPEKIDLEGHRVVTGEVFVPERFLPDLRAKYDTTKYKTTRTAAMSMLRRPQDHALEDVKLMEFVVFSCEGLDDRVSGTYEALKDRGFNIPPYITLKDGIPTTFNEFSVWFKNKMDTMFDLQEERGLPADGLVLEVSNYERKSAKGINFGYPYGLMRPSMCEKIFGNRSDENLAKTQRIIETFEKVKHLVVGFLNDVRVNTLKEVEIPVCLRRYLELGDTIPVGVVRNIKGFYKLFQLDDMNEQKAARIGRQSGNFPIQCFAAELFRIILMRAYISFSEQGWMQKDWVKWHIVIHDELLLSYRKDKIHPILLSKVIHEACTISIAGHTNYYIGINIGDTWGDCKKDERELPVHLVDRLIKRWDAGEFEGEVVLNPQSYMDVHRVQYISDRVHEVILSKNPQLSKDCIKCADILATFTNYTVRKYIYEDYKPMWVISKNEKGEDDMFDACLATWALKRYGEGVSFTLTSGHTITLTEELSELGKTFSIQDIINENFVESKLDIFEEEIIDEYSEMEWDLDNNGYSYTIDYDAENDELEFEDEFDMNKGDTFESMRVTEKKSLKNITLLSNRAKIKVTRKQEVSRIENLVLQHKLNEGEGIQLYYSSPVINSMGSFVSLANLYVLDTLLDEF